MKSGGRGVAGRAVQLAAAGPQSYLAYGKPRDGSRFRQNSAVFRFLGSDSMVSSDPTLTVEGQETDSAIGRESWK